MFFTIVKNSFARKTQRKLIAIAAVALGASVATAMLAVALGVGDKVNRELRSYGANIEALPRHRQLTVNAGGVQVEASGAREHLRETDIARVKSVFWGNNILALTPFLSCTTGITSTGGDDIQATLVGTWFDHQLTMEDGSFFPSGVRRVSPWWKVSGRWPEKGECLIGTILAERIRAGQGDELALEYSSRRTTLRVSGILATGAAEDDQIITDLAFVQDLTALSGSVDRLEVSALTNPEDDLARRDPATLSLEEYERWSCTPYPASVARDLETVLEGAEARPILRISRTEGTLLSRIDLMMVLVTIAALAAAVLGVSSTMMTTVLERKHEIGLMKAIGASNANVVSIFLVEATIVGLVGGVAGLIGGYALAQLITQSVFNSQLEITAIVAPVVLVVALGVAFIGSAVPLRAALKFDPSIVLRGE